MSERRDTRFRMEQLDVFDDEALATFLDPADGGIDPRTLGAASRGLPERLTARLKTAVPPDAAHSFAAAHDEARDDAACSRARAVVLDRLFWPLVYWTAPDEYAELVAGERLEPALVAALGLDAREVCDIGAGCGRFTLLAARVARRVVAVDATPALLQRLERSAQDAGLDNVVVRRGRFTALPLGDRSVDMAVACSAFMPIGPHGGASALQEAERVVRPGGEVAVVWPKDTAWLERRGFTVTTVPVSDECVHFSDAARAERLCELFYSADAAAWVREHRTADVPYSVIGVDPPASVCIKRIA